jgi:uncharacterized protein
MTIENRRAPIGAGTALDRAETDLGLRKYMLGVYNYMASGLLLTGIVALLVASSPAMMQTIFGTPLKWVVVFAPLAAVLAMGTGFNRFGAGTLQALFWGVSVLYGLSFSVLFMVFTGTSIARVLFITAATFGAMSLYGYTTQRDLSRFGSFLIMGVVGILIAALVNLIVQSSALQFAISVIGVLVFVGLTAYDTQRIRDLYYEDAYGDIRAKTMVMGALMLYIDSVGIFMYLMNLMGVRR